MKMLGYKSYFTSKNWHDLEVYHLLVSFLGLTEMTLLHILNGATFHNYILRNDELGRIMLNVRQVDVK